ncbi:MAG: IS200/IS605 family transposase [Bacteroidales bacterium]|nr:IS200/IS605 family transposase [Bacteroidales bacterium]
MKSMRNSTYTQIHIQTVFAVQNRDSMILNSWRDRLYKYLIAIIQNNGHKVLAIGGMTDHIHILIGMRPSQSLSDLIKDVKGCSSKWINENRLSNGWFSWQEGYGAFSYAKDDLPDVIRYIENQAEHHKQKNMVDEYKGLLEEFNIEYDEQKIFKQVE